MYKVIKLFTDLTDGNHTYNVGDIYPRNGVKVSEERIKVLSSSDNLQGQPLIELVEEPKKEKVEKVEIEKPIEKVVKKKPLKK